MKPILVVDDDPGFRKLLETILRGEGYEVESAAKVADARRLCAAMRFSLVVSDLKLPDGDGLDVQKWFAEQTPGTPFVLITGLDVYKRQELDTQAGIDAVDGARGGLDGSGIDAGGALAGRGLVGA